MDNKPQVAIMEGRKEEPHVEPSAAVRSPSGQITSPDARQGAAECLGYLEPAE